MRENMTVFKVGSRGVMFHIKTGDDWDLNLFLIAGKSCVYLIDSGRGSFDALDIKEYIDNHYPLKKIILINTHNHWDHVWGNQIFRDYPIISQTECYRIYCHDFERLTKKYHSMIAGEVSFCPPNMLIENSMTFPEDNICLIKSIGHTNDGLVVLDNEDKVLYIGDNIGDTVMQPIPDLVTSKEVYIEELKKLQNLDFSILASGHNILLDKDFLQVIIDKLI